LVDLQKEIEKRTFYLGKNRNAEGAQHLLDLIGMSRDEGDLLYPFAKAAMADVYDQLNASAIHIAKEYQWAEPVSPIVIRKKESLNTVTEDIDIAINAVNNKKIQISGTITDTGVGGVSEVNPALYRIEMSMKVNVQTECTVLETGTKLRSTKSVHVVIPAEYIRWTSKNTWTILPFNVDVPLDQQTEVTSAEKIFDPIVANTTSISYRLLFKDPVSLPAGTIAEIDGVNYEVTEDTDENRIDTTKNAVLVDTDEVLVEGVHYYFEVPNFLNMTNVAPLDNAIMEALVNRVIWKWLVLSYPTEAATYDTLYQDNLKSIATRCNIFNKHWQKTPRIF
jgi:hypothetical protein